MQHTVGVVDHYLRLFVVLCSPEYFIRDIVVHWFDIANDSVGLVPVEMLWTVLFEMRFCIVLFYFSGYFRTWPVQRGLLCGYFREKRSGVRGFWREGQQA